MATLKAIYRWAGRQIEGFVESVFKLMHITLAVPDHSTLSRRMKTLEIDIPGSRRLKPVMSGLIRQG